MKLRICAVFPAALLAFAQTSLVDQGIAAFRQGRYPQAVEFFQQAVNADTRDARAHQYLGVALMSRFVPGADAPENTELARRALSEFQIAIGLQPDNAQVMRDLATLNSLQATPARGEADRLHYMDEAAYWYNKLIALNPQDKEAHYSLGVLAWSRAFQPIQQARRNLGMRPEEPGPLRDAALRASLRSQYGQTIADGIQHLQKALEIDPQYDDAMAYLNLVFRERADLLDSEADYRRDIAEADNWVQQALQTKRAKAQNAAAPAPADPGEIRSSARMVMAPPPPPGGVRGGVQGGVIGGVISAAPPRLPGPDGPVPATIRVGANVQAARLIRQPAPEYPPLAMQARIQGVVRFNVVIGRDGKVSSATLVSGHPLLVPPATEAVRQYEYQPTLLNGTPVEVVTQVDVNFTLNR